MKQIHLLQSILGEAKSPHIDFNNFQSIKGRLPAPLKASFVRPQKWQEGLAFTPQTGRQKIIAPFEGEVLYAGPFGNYENLVILGVGEGWHILLALLDKTSVAAGQYVLLGEPVGTLAQEINDKPPQKLYMEIHHKGRPIDPIGWLAPW